MFEMARQRRWRALEDDMVAAIAAKTAGRFSEDTMRLGAREVLLDYYTAPLIDRLVISWRAWMGR